MSDIILSIKRAHFLHVACVSPVMSDKFPSYHLEDFMPTFMSKKSYWELGFWWFWCELLFWHHCNLGRSIAATCKPKFYWALTQQKTIAATSFQSCILHFKSRNSLWLCLWSHMHLDGCTLPPLCRPLWMLVLPGVDQLVFLLHMKNVNSTPKSMI